jgi:hypothetical protein
MNELSTAKVCPEHPDSPTDRHYGGDEYCGTCGRPYYEFIRKDLSAVDNFF